MKTDKEQKSEISIFKKTLHFTFATVCFLLLLSAPSLFAQKENSNQAISYTLADRDRLIQVEADIKSLRNEMQSLRNEMQSLRNEMITKFDGQDIRFESLQIQIDEQRNLFYWGFGILISVMLFLLGYNIWVRRTAIAPLKERTYTLSEKYTTLLQILKEFAKEQPKLAETLKMHGIL